MSSIYINGLSGKMGITLKNLIKDEPNLEIVETVKDSDLIIDFSRPESTMLVLQEAQEQKKPILLSNRGGWCLVVGPSRWSEVKAGTSAPCPTEPLLGHALGLRASKARGLCSPGTMQRRAWPT